MRNGRIKARVAQLVEAIVLDTMQCGFESRLGHQQKRKICNE